MKDAHFKAICVRMPADLLDKLDRFAEASHLSRARLLEISIRALVKISKKRGGNLFHTYSDHFAKAVIQDIKSMIKRHEHKE